MPLNRVVLVGRLTRDPEMKYTPQGVAVASFSIAVNRVTKGENGDYEVDFFNVTAWRRTAEFVSQYLTKGRLVSVDGRLQTRSWQDQATNQKRTVYEIVAENVDGLERKQDGEGGEAMGGSSAHYAEPGENAGASSQSRASSSASTAPAPRSAPSRPAPPPAHDDQNDEADPFADE